MKIWVDPKIPAPVDYITCDRAIQVKCLLRAAKAWAEDNEEATRVGLQCASDAGVYIDIPEDVFSLDMRIEIININEELAAFIDWIKLNHFDNCPICIHKNEIEEK